MNVLAFLDEYLNSAIAPMFIEWALENCERDMEGYEWKSAFWKWAAEQEQERKEE